MDYDSPGRRVANAFAWLSAGYILASFNVTNVVGSDGLPIEPSGKYPAGLGRFVIFKAGMRFARY